MAFADHPHTDPGDGRTECEVEVVEMVALPPGTTVTFSEESWAGEETTWDAPVLLRLNTGEIVFGVVNPSQGVIEVIDNPATAGSLPRLGSLGWFVSFNQGGRIADG